MKRICIALSVLPLMLALAQTVPPASQPVTDAAKLMDAAKAESAEVVVRGLLQPDPAGPGKGGWPAYTLTVAHVYKTPKDVKIEVGQKLTVKTVRQIDKPATFYLVYDTDQRLYRLQDPTGERGFSHVGEAATQPTTSSKPAEKVGVQVTVIAEKPKVIDGEPLTIQVEMKNTLDRAARLYTSTSHWQWRFQPPEGKGYWTLSQQFAEDRGWSVAIPTGKTVAMSFATQSARGQEYVFKWVGDEKKPQLERTSLPVGRYRLTIDMTLSTFSRPTAQPEPWEGKLTTNPVEFEVVEKKP